jgi:hypothetical protein
MAHGGKRRNAGRPKGVSTKILERQSKAAVMVESLGGDETWKWAKEQAAKKKDYRTVVEIMKYWTDKRDGRAAQAINLNAEEPLHIHLQLDPPTPNVVMPEKPAL